MVSNFYLHKRWILIAPVFSLIALLFTRSLPISSALGFLVLGIGVIRGLGERARSSHELDEVWPEVIDLLISGIQSGMSLTESFLGLQERGPLQLRKLIGQAGIELRQHGDFEKTLADIKKVIQSPSSDQICEALSIARILGGSELLYVLRALGDYLRADLATRREIDVKHGWIKNSAHLSAIAPWLLLLLLSTQKTTAEAFATSTGVLILIGGVAATCVAYLWMNFLARLPHPPRVFTS